MTFMSQISVFFAKKQYMYDKELEVINMRLIYTKPKLKDYVEVKCKCRK